MIRRLKNYYRAGSRMIKLGKILLATINQDKFASSEQFYKLYHYLPNNLEVTDVSVLKLSPESRIGDDNKLLVSRIKDFGNSDESIISLGKDCWTGKNVELHILNGTRIIIKDYSTIQDNCKIIGDVIVEKYCLFAPSVFVSSGNHYAITGNPDIIRNQDQFHLSNPELYNQHSKPVHIEEDCWIGYSAFIKQGLYIGRGAVIGANAVVTKDVAPYSIIGGTNNKIKERLEFSPPERIDASIFGHKPYFYRGFVHKNEESDIQVEKEYIGIGGSEDSVIILKKGTLNNISLSGKVLFRDNKKEVILSLIYNGNTSFSSILQIDEKGNFTVSVSNTDLTTNNDVKLEDHVIRLTEYYNVFHVSFKCKGNDSYPLIVVKNFEEQLL